MTGKGKRQGQEPYTAAELRRYLASSYGLSGRTKRLAGSHSAIELADGRLIPFHDKMITRPLARQIASALGISYPELRERLGVPLATGARSGRQPSRSKDRQTTKAEVLRSAHETRAAIDAVLEPLLSGDRDPVVYRAALERFAVAKDVLRKADA